MRNYLVIIPAYNEEYSICEVIEEVKAQLGQIDILVVNDGSTDKTSYLAQEAGATVLNLPVNIGYGGALQTGFRFAVKFGYDYVITVDADTQHDPASIKNMIETMDNAGADVVIGSRFLVDCNYKMGLLRRAGVFIFSKIAMAYTGVRFTDPTSGFQILNRKAFTYLSKRDNYPLDYPDVNIIMALHKMKFKIIEAPAKMRHKKTTKSMHSGLKPIIYVIRMFVAIMVVLLKKDK